MADKNFYTIEPMKLNLEFNYVSRVSETLSLRGYKTEIRECLAGSGKYQLLIWLKSVPIYGCMQLERDLEKEFNVSIMALYDSNNEVLDL
jgi:hypothetical protein